MANPFDALPWSELEDLHENMITGLINGLSVPCRLLFTGTKYEDCANCEDGKIIIGERSNNPYWGGGTGGVQTQNCPVCGGTGKIPVEVTETANLIVIFDNRKFMKFGENMPEGDAQVFCKKSLMPKLKNAAHIIFDTDIEEYKSQKFVRVNEPTPVGLGRNPFIMTVFKRA